MEKINSVETLRARILLLENRCTEEEAALKENFKKVQEMLKPRNLLKSAAKDIAGSFELNGGLVNLAASWALGRLSKRVVSGKDAGVFRSLLGSLTELLVTGGLSKHADTIKSAIIDVVQHLFNKEQNSTDIKQEPDA